MKLLLVLLAAVLIAANTVAQSLYEVSAGDEEDEVVVIGDAPRDQPCGFKQFVRETLTPLRNYG